MNICRSASLLLFAALPCVAQVSLLHPVGPGSQRNFFKVQAASAYVGYTSMAIPPSGGVGGLAGNVYGGDLEVGGSTSAGWDSSSPRGSFSGVYTLSYAGNVRHSEWNSLNHALSMTAARRLTPRWNFSFTVSGNVSNLAQQLFSPTVFGFMASAPASFDDFAAAVLAGKYTSDQIASLLTGVPVVESPARAAVFGQRTLSASTDASLSWRRSPRVNVSMSAGGTRSQRLPGAQTDGFRNDSYLIAMATSARASAGMDYSVSSRTRIGVQASVTRTVSRLQDAYTGSATFTAGTKFGRAWFADGRAGGGMMRAGRSTFALPQRPQYVAGGTLGFRERSHTILVSHDKTMGSSMGLIAGSTQTTNGAWNWTAPARNWTLFCSGGQEPSRGTALQVDGWRFNAGFGRKAGGHAWVQTTYAYLSSSGLFTGPLANLERHAVRVEVVWNGVAETGR